MKEDWAGIYGHKHNREILQNLITNSKVLPHALLFSGKEGIGKDFVAIRFAQLINLKTAPKSLHEQIYSGISNLNEPYLKYIFPLPRGKNEEDDSGPFEKLTPSDVEEIKIELQKKITNPYYHINLEKANTIKISSIRDISKFLSLMHDLSYYRIVLISDAHLMNETSQNALLKNLEEPPEKVIFILTTPYPDLLRETLRSRCWSLYFAPLSNSDVSKILIEYFNIEKNLAEEVSIFSDGSIILANKLLEIGFRELKSKTINFLRNALGKRLNSAYTEIADLIKNSNSEGLSLFIHMIITWLNDLQKERISSNKIFFSDYKETLEKFNKKFPQANIQELVSKIDRLGSLINNNINQNLIALNMIFNLSSLTK